MQHFFVTPSQVEGGYIYITGGDVNHMKNALRMKPGEELVVNDGNNRAYRCTIEGYSKEQAVVKIIKEQAIDTELPSRICLFQGLPKQDKMDMIVKKAVELGVYEVVPFASRRSVVKLEKKRAEKKVQRWQEIAESASKQAGRGYVPQVGRVLEYRDALKKAESLEVLLIPYELAEGMEETRRVIGSISPGQSVGIFIGPEGGFEKNEVEEAVKAGAKVVTLGKRILRTETAGLAALSILMYHLEGK